MDGHAVAPLRGESKLVWLDQPNRTPSVGTRDNREQNISMGWEGCDFSTTDTDFGAEGVGLDDVGGVRHTTAEKICYT